MPQAARLSDPASHMMAPMSPGAGSASVNIGGSKAWRALPAGLGAGIEGALDTMKQLVDSPTLNPVTTPAMLAQVFAGLMQDASLAAGKGSPSAPAATAGEFGKLMATNIKETATYTSAAAVPGGQPAAIAAYTLAMKKAAADFASAAINAIAGMTDIHNCCQPSGPIPHGPGVATRGSKSVFINGLPASRQGDKLFEAAGGSDPIARGCSSVNIGDDGGSPGAKNRAGSSTATAAEVVSTEQALAMAEQITWEQTRAAQPAPSDESDDPLATELTEDKPVSPAGEHWIVFRVVMDRTGEPVAGVPMRITLPDGKIISRTTNSQGTIDITELESPGFCSLSCSIEGARLPSTFDYVGSGANPLAPADPYSRPSCRRPGRRGGIIAEIEAHQVQTGETLDSVARQAGMTWQDLALFNWGTSNPDTINRHLRDEVGCRKTTRAGRNYVFDTADEPGIVYVPRCWSMRGLATDCLHTVRVGVVEFGARARRLRLFDGCGKAIPGAPYAIEIDGGEVTRGIADSEGDIDLGDQIHGTCTVRWSPLNECPTPEIIDDGFSLEIGGGGIAS